MEELASVALVMTNQGMVNPSQVAVHFTQNYGNKVDLPRELPGLSTVLSVSENTVYYQEIFAGFISLTVKSFIFVGFNFLRFMKIGTFVGKYLRGYRVAGLKTVLVVYLLVPFYQRVPMPSDLWLNA